jgi:hypothetical protein
VSSAEELTPAGVINLECLSLPFPDGTEPLFIAFYAGDFLLLKTHLFNQF